MAGTRKFPEGTRLLRERDKKFSYVRYGFRSFTLANFALILQGMRLRSTNGRFSSIFSFRNEKLLVLLTFYNCFIEQM